MRSLLIALVLTVAVAGAAAVATDARPGAALSVPGRSSANPSIAASDRFVAIAWGAAAEGGATDIYVAVSRDQGQTFGTPARVSDEASGTRLSGEQPPRIVLVSRAAKDPSIVVVWTGKDARGTRLLTARSDDGGKTFSPVSTVPGGDAGGNRGWESAVTDRDGHVGVLWLDHRDTVKSQPASGSQPAAAAPPHDHAAHGEMHDGAAMAERSQLFFSRLDGSLPSRGIARGVCYCCKTTIAAGPDGSLYAAWRHVYPGDIRDIAFTLSRDAGRTFTAPVRVSEDKWALKGCPENGPALAVDGRNRVHVVWPTVISGSTAGSDPTLGLFYSSTVDGHAFTPRQRVATMGTPYHPQIAVSNSGTLLLVWDELAAGTRRVALARGVADVKDGIRFAREAVVDTGGSSSYPVVASATSGFVLAWTSGTAASEIHVRRIP